jgi:tRNA (guanine37-N1)-methyltransferase
MLGLKVKHKYAQEVKSDLLSKGIFDKDYLPKKEKEDIIFPIIKSITLPNTIQIESIEFEKSTKITLSLKEALRDKLTEKELAILKTAYDTTGDIAILEIDEELRPKEHIIGKTLLDIQKQIKVVVRKDGNHEGTFRTQKMKIIAGENRLETTHIENGVKLLLNVETVYFSPRLSTERDRINKLVTASEEVLVMFSGCGVYPVNIGKNTKAKHVVGIEINPEGHNYALKNVILNKLKNVELYNGDVKEIVPKLNKKYDRILMPLPKSAEDFLDVALSVSKIGTIIHFYDFLHEDKFEEAHKKIEKACKKQSLKYKILNTIKCGQQSPKVYRICVDFEIC